MAKKKHKRRNKPAISQQGAQAAAAVYFLLALFRGIAGEANTVKELPASAEDVEHTVINSEIKTDADAGGKKT